MRLVISAGFGVDFRIIFVGFDFAASVKICSVFRVANQIFVDDGIKFAVLPAAGTFDSAFSEKIACAKNLVADKFKVRLFVIVDRNENGAVVGEQIAQEFEAGIHHAKPFIVSGEVFAFPADDFAEPALDSWVVDVIVVNPALVAGVVGRVDINAFDAAGETREQRFEREQVVGVNNHVGRVGAVGKFFVEEVEWRSAVVIYDFIFAEPVESWQG